ncbi:MAG TPA: hypothetical protein VK824_01910 [Planctomycetota bacterium]|nr:hypothetical protein [Planctomycetota bacterium]
MTLKTISTSDLQAELLRREKSVRELEHRAERLRRELSEIDSELAQLGAPAATAPARRRAMSGSGSGVSFAGSGEGGSSAGSGGGWAGGEEGGTQAEPRQKRARAKNAVSLADALAQCMEVRAVVTPAEAAEMVLRNGYTSTSKNLGMMVSNALARDTRFKRVSRGQYERIE